MNTSAELTIEEFEVPPFERKTPTPGDIGAEAAAQYLKAHERPHREREDSVLQEVTGSALAAAFVFGLFLGRYARV